MGIEIAKTLNNATDTLLGNETVISVLESPIKSAVMMGIAVLIVIFLSVRSGTAGSRLKIAVRAALFVSLVLGLFFNLASRHHDAKCANARIMGADEVKAGFVSQNEIYQRQLADQYAEREAEIIRREREHARIAENTAKQMVERLGINQQIALNKLQEPVPPKPAFMPALAQPYAHGIGMGTDTSANADADLDLSDIYTPAPPITLPSQQPQQQIPNVTGRGQQLQFQHTSIQPRELAANATRQAPPVVDDGYDDISAFM